MLWDGLEHPVAELGHELEVGWLTTVVELVFKHLENIVGVATEFDAALLFIKMVQVVLNLFAPVELILRESLVLVGGVEAQEL